MINIHEQLWVIKGHNRVVEDSDYLLAYMTHREYTNDGEETKSFVNRASTGRKWAAPHRYYNHDKKAYEQVEYSEEDFVLEFDNVPVKGFKIIGSVSRWSTSNKLIRVEDPRGFVVEIPTGNLTTLLKHTKVEYGEVMEECVWGREGNNHILLPVNSSVYKKAKEDTSQYNSKVNIPKLNVGDVVKFSVDSKCKYVYCGRGKAEWEVKQLQATKVPTAYSWFSSSYRWSISENDPVIETKRVKDTKLCYIFKQLDQDILEYKTSGKCVVVGKSVPPQVKPFKIPFPDRLKWDGMHLWGRDQYTGVYYGTKVINIEMKQ